MGQDGHSHWSDFWATGALTSLPQDFRGNYDGELAEFWQGEFSALADDARILDVCTGNGALAIMAAEYSRSQARGFSITAVDAARMDPERIATEHPGVREALAAIRFLPETPMEASGLPGGAFDFIMSQYGIEYCDWSAAAAEIVRLLVPGGHFSLVAHAADSAMLAMMRSEAQEYAWLADAGLFDSVDRWLAGALPADGFRRKMEVLGPSLAREAQSRQSALFQGVLRMVHAAATLPDAELIARQADFADYLDQLRQGRARLEDFLRVNQGIADTPDWYRVFVDAGLVLLDQGQILYRGRHHSGHYYRFHLPAG